MKKTIIAVVLLIGMRAYALTDEGIVHRWSLNGDFLDSVGGSALSYYYIGSDHMEDVDGRGFKVLGGSFQGEYDPYSLGFDGPTICTAETTALTIEIWATQHSWQSDSSIFQIGKKKGIGMFWDCNAGTEYSTNGLVKIDGAREYVSTIERVREHKAVLGPYALNVPYHIALVISKQGDGTWRFISYKQDANTGETLRQEEHVKDSAWSFAKMENVELTLGYGDFDKYGPAGAHATYDEVRVWNRALTESELTESAKEGPDTKRFGKLPSMPLGNVYATNVVARQRYPWNGKVDIEFDVVGQSEDERCFVLQAQDVPGGSVYKARSVTGDCSFSEGHHKIVWDLDADGINMVSDCVRFIVFSPLYCVIDLSSGKNSSTYPVEYLSSKPEGLLTDTYKTTKLVFRWCGPCVDDMGMYASGRAFYAGVFELTRGQKMNIVGDSQLFEAGSDTCPATITFAAGGLGYNYRGGLYGGERHGGSFIDQVRSKTSLCGIGLPTENLWRWACLAGQTGQSYSFGDDSSLLHLYGWSYENSESTMHPVGEKLCNAWGLYDMHGNVWEGVIGRYDNGNDLITFCGGSYNSYATGCTATRALGGDFYDGNKGVRLFMSSPWDR